MQYYFLEKYLNQGLFCPIINSCSLYIGKEQVPSGGATVATQKKSMLRQGLPKKTYWHLYSLQTLQSEKLALIVNKVLKQEYVLIK